MKMIRFVMSKGDPIIVSEIQARAILASDQQIVPIVENGEWTGEVVNKAHIVSSYRDVIAESDKRLEESLKLPSADRPLTEEEKIERQKLIDKVRQDLKEVFEK